MTGLSFWVLRRRDWGSGLRASVLGIRVGVLVGGWGTRAMGLGWAWQKAKKLGTGQGSRCDVKGLTGFLLKYNLKKKKKHLCLILGPGIHKKIKFCPCFILKYVKRLEEKAANHGP